MNPLLLALPASALLWACASTPPEAVAAAEGERLHCTREMPTGTNIPVTRCRTREQIERERRAAEEVRDVIRSGVSGPRDGPGR